MRHGVENEGEGKKTGCVTSLQPLAEGSSTHIFPKEHAPIEPARGEDSPSQLSVRLCDPPLFGLRRQCLQLSLLVPCLDKDPTALWSPLTSCGGGLPAPHMHATQEALPRHNLNGNTS